MKGKKKQRKSKESEGSVYLVPSFIFWPFT